MSDDSMGSEAIMEMMMNDFLKPEHVVITGSIVWKTAMAFRIKTAGMLVWIPKSQIHIAFKNNNTGKEYDFHVSHSFLANAATFEMIK